MDGSESTRNWIKKCWLTDSWHSIQHTLSADCITRMWYNLLEQE